MIRFLGSIHLKKGKSCNLAESSDTVIHSVKAPIITNEVSVFKSTIEENLNELDSRRWIKPKLYRVSEKSLHV